MYNDYLNHYESIDNIHNPVNLRDMDHIIYNNRDEASVKDFDIWIGLQRVWIVRCYSNTLRLLIFLDRRGTTQIDGVHSIYYQNRVQSNNESCGCASPVHIRRHDTKIMHYDLNRMINSVAKQMY